VNNDMIFSNYRAMSKESKDDLNTANMFTVTRNDH
jgi:hypothetical protein